MKVAVDEWSFHNSMMWRGMTLEAVIRKVGELRADGIGFDYFMLSKEMRKEAARVKDLLSENGLELVFGFSMPFALPEITFRLMEKRKDEMFDLAHAFGAKIIRVIGGVVLPNQINKAFHVSFSRTKEVERVAANLKEFARDAALEGMTVALENHSDYTTDEMLEILDRVAEDNMKVTLDTGNALYLGEDPIETADRLAPHAVYTHIKDMKKTPLTCMSVPLGDGEIDIRTVVSTLKKHNYEGLYSIEVDLPFWMAAKEEEVMKASIEYLKSLDAD